MNIDDKEHYILCIRQEDAKRENITEGSTTTNCCECDSALWISPASVDVMLQRKAKPVCLQCAAGHSVQEIKPPSAGQLKEIIRELKKELDIENPTDRFKD